MKAYVTGAAGFVGAAVVRALLAEDIAVQAQVRPGSDTRNLSGLNVGCVLGDVRDVHSMTQGMQGCAWVFHIAAYYSNRDDEAEQMYAVNAAGTENVLRAAEAAGAERIIHCSTIGAIGQTARHGMPDESSPVMLAANASHYARSKLAGEQAALAAAQRGQPVVVVNPCAPIGPRDIKPSSAGKRIVDALNGKAPSYLEGGINHVAVEDVAQGHILAARKGRVGERYILGNQNLLLEDFLRLVEEAADMRLPRASTGWHPLLRLRHPHAGETGHKPRSLIASPAKAIQELGLPQTPLRLAFAAAVAWFRHNGYVRPQG